MLFRAHVKAIAKALTWRIVGALDTFAIAYFITGKTSAAVGVVGLEALTKSVWFYFHERAWETAIVPMIAKAILKRIIVEKAMPSTMFTEIL